MSLIDRTILEWAWMSEKGYPDINNKEDMKVFESMFGFNLNETPLTPKELGKTTLSKTLIIPLSIFAIFILAKSPKPSIDTAKHSSNSHA